MDRRACPSVTYDARGQNHSRRQDLRSPDWRRQKDRRTGSRTWCGCLFCIRKRELASSGLMPGQLSISAPYFLSAKPDPSLPKASHEFRPNRCPGERPHCSRCQGRWPNHSRRQSLYRRSQNPVLVRRTNHLKSESRFRRTPVDSYYHARTVGLIWRKNPSPHLARACPLERRP